MAADADIRELADAIRDLATAQDRSRQDRIEMRVEGAERGKLVVDAVREVMEQNTKAIDEMRRVKAGMPWLIAAPLLTFNALLTIFVVAIYAGSNGDDAAAAAKVATEIVPSMPSAGMGEP